MGRERERDEQIVGWKKTQRHTTKTESEPILVHGNNRPPGFHRKTICLIRLAAHTFTAQWVAEKRVMTPSLAYPFPKIYDRDWGGPVSWSRMPLSLDKGARDGVRKPSSPAQNILGLDLLGVETVGWFTSRECGIKTSGDGRGWLRLRK